MQNDPTDDSQQRASERIEAARKLITRRRFEDALEALNEAIAIAPGHPLAYALRAEVFEALGLKPQAEADREPGKRLASTAGYPDSDVVDGADEVPEPRPEPGSVDPSDRRPRRSLLSDGVTPIVFTTLLIVGAVAAVIGGVMIAIEAFDDDGVPSLVPSPLADTATPALTITPAPTQAPSPQPTALLSGSPYSLSSVQDAWGTAGFEATIGEAAAGFTGFAVTPTDVTLDGGAARFAVFVYPDRDAPQTDWDLIVGERPSPKPGRTLPDHVSVWWNGNIVAVVRAIDGGVSSAALEAFLDMTP